MSQGTPKVLLVSLRDPADPMAAHEVTCFARHLGLPEHLLQVHPMPRGRPHLEGVDLVLFGGSGAYSVLDHVEVRWIAEAIDVLVEVVERRIPAWASCFGFQGLALALGGQVTHDVSRQEMGSVWMTLTAAGQADPVFGTLPPGFWAQQGHQDHVDRLPAGVTLMAEGRNVRHQAFKVDGAPFWAAQFHPELTVQTTLDRARHYAERYMTAEQKAEVLETMGRGQDTPEVGRLLGTLLAHVTEVADP